MVCTLWYNEIFYMLQPKNRSVPWIQRWKYAHATKSKVFVLTRTMLSLPLHPWNLSHATPKKFLTIIDNSFSPHCCFARIYGSPTLYACVLTVSYPKSVTLFSLHCAPKALRCTIDHATKSTRSRRTPTMNTIYFTIFKCVDGYWKQLACGLWFAGRRANWKK